MMEVDTLIQRAKAEARSEVAAAWKRGIADRKADKVITANPYQRTGYPGSDYDFWSDGWLWWERTEVVADLRSVVTESRR